MDPEFISFPSIEQFRHVLKELPYVFGSNDLVPEKLRFRGTVKLHGTHADIVRHFDSKKDVIQSRNRILSADSDNQGCYNFLNPKNFAKLFNQIQTIYGSDIKSHIMICGEYCGKGIQSKVALCKLDKMFVIFAIRIDYKWVDMSDYKAVSSEEEAIYNIMNFPMYEVEIDLTNLQPAQDYMTKLTESIDSECPFAHHLAGIKGAGEGLVWTCMDHDSSRLWFKTKGKTHCTALTEAVPSKTETIKIVTEFVESVVTESRLNQGIDYLREFGIELEIKNINRFVSWVCQDVFKEERDTIEENVIYFNVNDVRKAIYKMAGEWYKKVLEEKVDT